MCGSSDNDAYIWRTDGCSSLPWVLKGHESEVTSVAWAPFDGEKVGKEKMEAFNRVDDTLNLSFNLSKDSWGQSFYSSCLYAFISKVKPLMSTCWL